MGHYARRNTIQHSGRGPHPAGISVLDGRQPYVPQHADDAALAAGAWNQVAVIQARLRGEPPPQPIRAPWKLPPCDGCGYRFRCECPEEVAP